MIENCIMKYFFLCFFFCTLFSCNQKDKKTGADNGSAKRDTLPTKVDINNPFASTDLSPMDMVYFPVDYPKLKMTKTISTGPKIRVIYSRPQKQGRKIFGDLLPYGQPWRLGANEVTEIEFFEPATIQDKKVNKGRYAMYCIPQEKRWTVVLNSNIDSWGLQQDPQKDILRFEIPSEKLNTPIEYFTMAFEPTENGANLIMTWDDVLVELPITL